MAGYNNKIVAVIVFSAIMTIATQSSYSSVQSLAQEDSGEPQVPQAICNYAGQKYYLTPHIYNDGEKSSRMNFLDLPKDHMPQMIVKKGGEITMEFDDKSLLKYKYKKGPL